MQISDRLAFGSHSRGEHVVRQGQCLFDDQGTEPLERRLNVAAALPVINEYRHGLRSHHPMVAESMSRVCAIYSTDSRRASSALPGGSRFSERHP